MHLEAFPWHARFVEMSAIIYVLNFGQQTYCVKKHKVNEKDEYSKFLFFG